jgi:hypothetical protein
MKKLLLALVTVFVITACSLDDGQETMPFHLEFVPVQDVEVPEVFSAGGSYTINLKYNRPSDCYYVQDTLYSEVKENQFTYAIQAVVLENKTCNPIENTGPEVKSFKFICNPAPGQEYYVLKFYNGTSAGMGTGTGNSNTFIEVRVPIKY